MKNIYLLILSLSLVMVSCNNWLDIEPELEVREGGMYQREQGFMDVLTGAYIRMATADLYGLNTTVRLPELMANHWQYSTNTLEYFISTFDFTYSGAESLLETVWLQYYQTIVNINALLEQIDGKKNIFTDGNYELIKGEALGLRAFLHLEILRYWGASPRTAVLDNKAIPYATIVTKDPNQLLSLSYREVYSKILEDLKEAEKLLVDDPIRKYTNAELNSPKAVGGKTIDIPDFHYYRQIKFNYYAVKATLARYYSWLGDSATAAGYAREVIDAKNEDEKGKFTLGENLQASNGDLTFTSEHIFAVHNSISTTTLQDYFFSYRSMYTQDHNKTDEAYEATLHPGDIRYYDDRLWEEKHVPLEANRFNFFRKYYDTETTAIKQIPLIRLSEMHFIATENGDAAAFRTYRIARNLQSYIEDELNTQAGTMERLEKEYRKEFYGEGQMFFFYKRLGYTRFTWPSVKEVEIQSYKLPIPDSQASFE